LLVTIATGYLLRFLPKSAREGWFFAIRPNDFRRKRLTSSRRPAPGAVSGRGYGPGVGTKPSLRVFAFRAPRPVRPALFQQIPRCLGDGRGQPVLLKQVAKAQDGTLVRDYVVIQLDPSKSVASTRCRRSCPRAAGRTGQITAEERSAASSPGPTGAFRCPLSGSAVRSAPAAAPTELPRPSRPGTVRAASPCPSPNTPARQMSAAHTSPTPPP